MIKHPCHPWTGCRVTVLRYNRLTEHPSAIVDLPDGRVVCIPLSWTDQALPSVDTVAGDGRSRLSGRALLEVVQLLEAWSQEEREEKRCQVSM